MNLQEMLQYISLHFSEPITLEDLARSASISKSECGRVFRQALEKTPYQYLLEYRLQRGAELLSKTDLPIGAIAESVGFAQMSYFGQSFRNKTGLSPSAYRRAKRQNDRGRLTEKPRSD